MNATQAQNEPLTDAERKSVRKEVEKERYRKTYNQQATGYVKWWTYQFIKIALYPIAATAVLASLSFIHANWIVPGHERKTQIQTITEELLSRIEFAKEKLSQWDPSDRADNTSVKDKLNTLIHTGDRNRSNHSLFGRTFFALAYELQKLTGDDDLHEIIDNPNIREGALATTGDSKEGINTKLNKLKNKVTPSDSDGGGWSLTVSTVLVAAVTSVFSSIATWLIIRRRYLSSHSE